MKGGFVVTGLNGKTEILRLVWLVVCETVRQGCPQDVKSQDRDETETVNLQDRDEIARRSIFQTLKTETRRDVQPSRPRRDGDVPKNASRPQCRSLKTSTGEVCYMTTCFLRVRSIIFFVICPKA